VLLGYDSSTVSLGSLRKEKHALIQLELFNETIIEIMFSYKNAHLLPFERHYPMQRPGRIAFAKILEGKLVDESSARSPLHLTTNGCINLIETLSLDSQDNIDRRQVYNSILCARTVTVLSMRQAIRCLSAQGETPVENPSLGALALAAAIGNDAIVLALLAQGALFEDESSVFGSALHAAAEYGHMNVLEIAFNISTLPYDAFIGGIRGGNKEIVGKLLDQYEYDSMLHGPGTEGGEMVVRAPAEDQTEILDILMEHIPTCHEGEFLKRALYNAVLFSAKLTTRQLLKAGVDISNHEESLGNGLYVASKCGDLETVQLLIEHGFTNGHGPNSFDACMHVVAAKGYIYIVEFFLHHGVDVNCRFSSPTAPSGMDEDFWDCIDGSDPATTNAACNGDFRMFCYLVQRCRVDLKNEFSSVQKQWLERLQAWEESRLLK
jgi:ankyrin repeat protein